MMRLKDFIDRYYSKIYFAVYKLAGDKDPKVPALITEMALAELWANRSALAADPRPGIFIYKIILKQVLSWLKQQGATDRIRALEQVILLDPSEYAHLL